MRLLFILFTFFCSYSFVHAQVENKLKQDMIVLKNQTRIEGEILEVNKKWVVIKKGSVPFSFHRKKINAIYMDGEVISLMSYSNNALIQGNNDPEFLDKSKFEKRGFYNITYGAIHFQEKDFNNIFFENIDIVGGTGFGIENITGFQVSQFTGLGLGIGYHSTGWRDEVKTAPIYAEYRGYFSMKKVSAFYSLSYGALFAVKNENSRFISSRPGTYFYPAIGFKSGTGDSAFTVDLGVRFGKVFLTEEDNSRAGMSENELSFRGVGLRIGVML